MIIAIIGAGAAGLMAAISAGLELREIRRLDLSEDKASFQGIDKILLFEKNSQLGKKILITGNGRCNVTNSTDVRSFPDYYFGNGKFLSSALRTFSPQDCRNLFETYGVRLIEEAGGKIFPASNKAADIVFALRSYAQELGVIFKEDEAIADIRQDAEGKISKVLSTKNSYEVDACILCAGGSSYPATGSAGDGVRLAGRLGHTIIPIRPSIAAIEIDLNPEQAKIFDKVANQAELVSSPEETMSIPGISLKEVTIEAFCANQKLCSAKGDILFTHTGLTGPAIFRISRFLPIEEKLYTTRQVRVAINLWPEIAKAAVGEKLLQVLQQNQKKKLSNVLREFWPEGIVSLLLVRSDIPLDTYCHELKKALRQNLINNINALQFKVNRPPVLKTAMVTAGGVSLSEVDPKTMASKLVSGLFLAGELLDIDGDTGGFNLQAAFSTGYTAGQAAVKSILTEK